MPIPLSRQQRLTIVLLSLNLAAFTRNLESESGPAIFGLWFAIVRLSGVVLGWPQGQFVFQLDHGSHYRKSAMDRNLFGFSPDQHPGLGSKGQAT
jgi:hypothetical protein